MAYVHENGIRSATQFHPEHHYMSDKEGEVNHEHAWLENFINLAVMHHYHVHNNGMHPLEYMQGVQEQLNKCMIEQICMADYSLVNDFLLYTQETCASF